MGGITIIENIITQYYNIMVGKGVISCIVGAKQKRLNVNNSESMLGIRCIRPLIKEILINIILYLTIRYYVFKIFVATVNNYFGDFMTNTARVVNSDIV